MSLPRLNLQDLPEYKVGDEIVISVNGEYREATVIPLEVYWKDQTWIRAIDSHGQKHRLRSEDIVQMKQA